MPFPTVQFLEENAGKLAQQPEKDEEFGVFWDVTA